MINVEALTRTYGDLTAVDQVSFEIGQGEIVGLLGHNGAGKTTIMKMLTGYLEPTGGSIEVDGLNIATQREAVQSRIGYLPENDPLYPEMTVIDYLDYAASLHAVPESRRAERIREAIDKTELTSKAVDTIGTLSRGYRQRVGVAQAILHDPRVLILDEPTNGLDPTQVGHMRELIQSLANHCKTTDPSITRFSTPFGEQWPFGDDMFKRFFGDRLPSIPRMPKQEAPQRERRAIGQGSGFVFAAKDGLFSDKTYILTNNHVVEDADKIRVKFQDGREFDAKVTGRDPQSDVAVVEIKAAGLPSLAWGDSSGLEVGEW